MRSIASCRRAFPSAERCDLPSELVSISPGVQPGGFAQGPDEKCGRAGNVAGFGRRNVAPAAVVSVNATLLPESTRRVGTAWPEAGSNGDCGIGKAKAKISPVALLERVIRPSFLSTRAPESSLHRAERTIRPATRNIRLNSLTPRGQSSLRQRVVGKSTGKWGLGSSFNIGFFGLRSGAAAWMFGARGNDQVFGGNVRPFQGPRLFRA